MCEKHYRRYKICLDIEKVDDDSLWGFKKHTDESKQKLRLAHLGKHGHPHTQEHKQHMSKIQMGSHNGMWKGDSIGYKALHDWVHRHIPKPDHCPNCGMSKRLHACNISGKYHRDVSDWEYLCGKCHCVKYKHNGHNPPNPYRIAKM